jgi:leader peptidase (prepilin peptidase)/N-methyltransferase
LTIIPYILTALAGLFTGWIANIIAHRFPIEERAIFAPLRCLRGGERLRWYDHFPIFGYLFQKGVCRHCGKKLPFRFPLLEILMVAAFVGAWPRYENLPFYIYAINIFYVALLLIIGAIDLRHRLIFPAMIYLGCIVSIVAGIFNDPLYRPFIPELSAALIGALFCGITFQLLYWMAIAIYRVRALGFGDVLLAVLIGLTLGFPSSIVSLFMGAVLNGIAAGLVWAFGKKGRREFIPYGTTLCIAAALVLMFGDSVWRWGPMGMLADLLGIGLNIIFRFFASIFGLPMPN